VIRQLIFCQHGNRSTHVYHVATKPPSHDTDVVY